MFDSIGWPEIFAIVIIGIIIIGPEKMPRVIEDVRAAIFAARKAINNAKAELNGEFGEDFEEFRKPLSQIADIQRMGPRGALSKALFDGDDEFMDSFNPKKLMSEDPKPAQQPPAPRAADTGTPQPARPTFNYAEIYSNNKKQDAPAPKPDTSGGQGAAYKDVI